MLNLTIRTLMVMNEITDEAKRYRPQPVLDAFSVRKVIMDDTLLSIPSANMSVVRTIVSLTTYF